MKNHIVQRIAWCVTLLALWPSAASADAVGTWNENAAKAATAACLHISGNGLVEARMYAMVHAAVHDAVNAIDRRSRPYAFRARVNGPVSADAAVAAAARDTLVSVIPTLPESPDCRASGVALANDLYAAALASIPNGPAKAIGVALGQAAAAAIVWRRAGDGSDQNMFVDTYEPGTEPGEWRFTPDFPFPIAFGPDWGKVTPFVLKRSSQFRPRPPFDLRSRKYAADYNEIKAAWRRRRQHAERALAGPDRDRAVLDRKLAAGVESPGSRALSRTRVRSLGERAVVRVAQSGDGGRLYRVVGGQVSTTSSGARSPRFVWETPTTIH